jgi:hypothetical protein
VADALAALKAKGLVEEEPATAYAPCLEAAVKVYKLRLTERGREAARQTAANLPEELTPPDDDPRGLSLTPLGYVSSFIGM